MDFEEKWQEVIAKTQIHSFYKHRLSRYETTTLPYTFLGASLINHGDTVVRRGSVIVDKPLIFLPRDIPQFTGFELEEELGVDEDNLRFFFMIRGINFPSLKYKHEISSIDVLEKDPEEAISFYRNEIERKEDIETGLIFGPVETWQLSILFYVNILINRSTSKDLEHYLEEIKKRFFPD